MAKVSVQKLESPQKLPIPTLEHPFVLSVANLKGGVAKTTTAVHAAEYLRRFGPTVLVDSDPNHSAMAWSKKRSVPDFHVISEMEMYRFAGKTFSFVVDTKARPDADDCAALIDISSAIILPTSANGDDLRVTIQTANLLSNCGSSKHRVLITKARTQAACTETLEAQKLLKDMGVPYFKRAIRQYVAYPHAFLEGLPVGEIKNPKSKDAWSDYQAVMEELLDV